MKSFFCCLLFFFLSITLVLGQETKAYTLENNPIANPERGFYHHTEVHSVVYNFLDQSALEEYRSQESITQILRVFYLENFVNRAISKEYLDNMHIDFNTARAAGIKVIVRFAYTQRSTKPYGDAFPKSVKNHIFQLKEVLTTHSDVIAVVQTGFIGAWGEWYYTDHFAGEHPWIISDENWADRKTVVDDLLQVLPKNRMIQLRTPGYKMTVFDTEDPIDLPMAFSKENISRTGHHNDCFVASASDLGTYVNPDLEKPYLEEETKFLPMGGETCGLAPPYSDCTNAYSELNRFHWSYLNIDYNKSVLNVWKDQGCYEDVELNLGYRYDLKEATLQTEVHPEGTFDLSLSLFNHGFANPYNPRDFEVILKSVSSDQVYRLITEETINLWPIQENFDINIEAGFPSDVIEDTYKVYLNLSDQSPSLAETPAYSIRLANQDLWEETQGWNDLGFELTINQSLPNNSYQGNLIFTSLPVPEINSPGPTSIYQGVNEGVVLLFWGRSQNHEYRRIERSLDGVNFETIANLPATNDFYKILDQDNDYYYRFSLLGQGGEITHSDNTFVPNPSTSIDPKIEISTDGLDEDWKDVLPTASFVDQNNDSYVLRTYFSNNKGHFSIYGNVQDYKIYLNTDQDIATGTDETDLLKGMDYKLEDGTLYKYQNNQWENESTDIISTGGSIFEIELDHGLFENMDRNALLPIVAYLNGENILLSESETTPSIYIRNLPAEVPDNFMVKNSIPFPEERLEIHWDRCLFCDGYILEKSDNGTDFVFLADLLAEKEIYYHDFLPNGTHYYRIKTYNILGESPYSDIKIGTLWPTSTKDISATKFITVWPNPASDFTTTDLDYDKILVYNTLGKLFPTPINADRSIDTSKLPRGIYYITFIKEEKRWISKLIKQ